MQDLRTFVAIDLGENLAQGLAALERQLRGLPGANGVRWVAVGNIHLTLKFMGNIPQGRVDELGEAVATAAARTGGLELYANGVGCFPDARRPRVVWVGLTGDVSRLSALASRIENALAAKGIPREDRGFTPHLTLGRVKREATTIERAKLGEAIKNLPPGEYGVIRADAVRFIKSDLRSEGPIYTTLRTISL
ncbi:MAG: RNA 2',3'-cyclic phosphodiesterase [Rudaea sp.]